MTQKIHMPFKNNKLHTFKNFLDDVIGKYQKINDKAGKLLSNNNKYGGTITVINDELF